MKKLIFVLILVMLLFVGGVSASSNGLVNGYGIDGTTVNAGSAGNPYAINDLADLQAISSTNWGAGVYYQQTADITLTNSLTFNPFQGTYNGKGYKINGANSFYINFKGNNVTQAYLMNIWYYQIKGTYVCSGYVITMSNCMFDSCTTSTDVETALVGYRNNPTIVNNVFVKSCTLNGGNSYVTRWSSPIGHSSNDVSGNTGTNAKNIVVISTKTKGSGYNYRAVYASTKSNIYASSDCTPTSTSTDANSNYGATITSTQYNSQSWWESTAHYNFDPEYGAWEWDSATQLPKLSHNAKTADVVIRTVADLQSFATRVNAGETTLSAIMANDVDLTGVTWTTIGTSTYPYGGNFDGNGYTISSISGVVFYSDSSTSSIKNTRFYNCDCYNTETYGYIIYGGAEIAYCEFDSCDINTASIFQSIVCFPINIHDCVFKNCSMYFNNVNTGMTYEGLISARSSSPTTSISNICAIGNSYYMEHKTSSNGGIGYITCSIPDGESTALYVTASNSAVISASSVYTNTNRVASGVGYNYKSNYHPTPTKVYVLDTLPVSTSASVNTGFMASTPTSASQYNQQGFWNGTGISGTTYLSWDFTNTWYWDSLSNLPKLQVFNQINAVVLTSPSECYEGDVITAYVSTTGNQFQWYGAMGEELAVEYDTSGTNNFSKTVSGNTYITVLSTDGNHYYYSPTLDAFETPKTALSGIWESVNTVDYIQSSGSQYIDTGAYFNSNTDAYSVQYQLTSSESIINMLFGGGDAYSNNGELLVGYASADSTSLSALLQTNNMVRDTCSFYQNRNTGETHTIDYFDKNYYLDDSLVHSVTTTYTIDTTYTTTLFALNRGGSATFNGYFKLYYYTYSRNGEQLRDYVPIYYNGRYSLYDKCLSGDVIYDNDGTGSFSGGGTPTPLTYTHTYSWSPLSGQTTANLSYSESPAGINLFKVLVNGYDSTAKFPALQVTVIEAKPRILSFTLTNPSVGVYLPTSELVTGTVNATLNVGTMTYQWYYSDSANNSYSVIYPTNYPISVSNGSYGTTSGYLYKAVDGGYYNDALGFVAVANMSGYPLFSVDNSNFTLTSNEDAIIYTTSEPLSGDGESVATVMQTVTHSNVLDKTTWQLKYAEWNLTYSLEVPRNVDYTVHNTPLILHSYSWQPISSQTSANLSYSAPVGDFYYKVIVSGNGFDTDSLSKYEPFHVISFNGIVNNTITTADDFDTWIFVYQYYQNETLYLGNDVTLNTPLSIPLFKGTFNGNEHTLSGLKSPLFTVLSGNVSQVKFKDSFISSAGNIGVLSSNITSATISNVDVENCYLESTNMNAGTVAGAVLGSGTKIDDCSATRCTVVGRDSAGGITGLIQTDTEITNAKVSSCDILSPRGIAYGVSP